MIKIKKSTISKYLPKKKGKFSLPVKATPQQIAARWKKKKNSLSTLAGNIQSLRYNITRSLQSDDQKEFLTALAIDLMDHTAERVGNAISADNNHFGISNLQKRHVTVERNTVTLKYVGKSGVKHEKTVTDKDLADNVRKAINMSDTSYLLCTSDGFCIKPDRINRYLKDYDITAKDLRGYSANKWIVDKLRSSDVPETDKLRKKEFNRVAKIVAAKVGHGVGTLKNQYLLPTLESDYINKGHIVDMKNIGGMVKLKSGGEVNNAIKKSLIGDKVYSTKDGNSTYNLYKYGDTGYIIGLKFDSYPEQYAPGIFHSEDAGKEVIAGHARDTAAAIKAPANNRFTTKKSPMKKNIISKLFEKYKSGGPIAINPDDKIIKNTITHKSGSAGGMLVGNRHSEGGIKAINKSNGQPLEMEGGEVVITRDAVSDPTPRKFGNETLTNRQILSRINAEAGGVSFADGGEVPEEIMITGKEYEVDGKPMFDYDIVESCGCKHTKMKAGGATLSMYTKDEVISKGLMIFTRETGIPIDFKDFKHTYSNGSIEYYLLTKPISPADIKKIQETQRRLGYDMVDANPYNPFKANITLEMRITSDYVWSPHSKYSIGLFLAEVKNDKVFSYQNVMIFPYRDHGAKFEEGGKVEEKELLNKRVDDADKKLNDFCRPHRTSDGLVSDDVRNSSEYIKLNNEFKAAFRALQEFNKKDKTPYQPKYMQHVVKAEAGTAVTEALPEISGLNAYDLVYLFIKIGYKPAYRLTYLIRSGLNKTDREKQAIEKLTKKGYLNSAGAITEDGKKIARESLSKLGLRMASDYNGQEGIETVGSAIVNYQYQQQAAQPAPPQPGKQRSTSTTGDRVKFREGHGYWDLTRYPYGGDFSRFKGGEEGTIVKGTRKRGDEIRVKLDDGREIITAYRSLDMPFEDAQALMQRNEHLFTNGYESGGEVSKKAEAGTRYADIPEKYRMSLEYFVGQLYHHKDQRSRAILLGDANSVIKEISQLSSKK